MIPTNNVQTDGQAIANEKNEQKKMLYRCNSISFEYKEYKIQIKIRDFIRIHRKKNASC